MHMNMHVDAQEGFSKMMKAKLKGMWGSPLLNKATMKSEDRYAPFDAVIKNICCCMMFLDFSRDMTKRSRDCLKECNSNASKDRALHSYFSPEDKRKRPSEYPRMMLTETTNSARDTSDENRKSQTKAHPLAKGQVVPYTYNPLPRLKWADPADVWQVMKKKDSMYIRDPHLLRKHPLLTCKMRSILLDWIMEVCEVYRLHRETFHLAVDFIDRYLSLQINIEKNQLQLIGVAALFTAAKLEEIYPPRIVDFAYVTDGACSEDDICRQELLLLKCLRWDLAPMTVNMWLSIYMQLLNNTEKKDETTLTPVLFSGHSFVQITRLADLCMLDYGSLQFPCSHLAASVLYHFSDELTVFQASGYTWDDIGECINWVAPFAITVRDNGVVHMKTFENVMFSDSHNIQTHDVDLDMLMKAQTRQKDMRKLMHLHSPEHKSMMDVILTPPSSNRKPRILRH